jgi:hypothetical protein
MAARMRERSMVSRERSSASLCRFSALRCRPLCRSERAFSVSLKTSARIYGTTAYAHTYTEREKSESDGYRLLTGYICSSFEAFLSLSFAEDEEGPRAARADAMGVSGGGMKIGPPGVSCIGSVFHFSIVSPCRW